MNKTYKTIIIDDEFPARERLKDLLKVFNEIEIVDEAADGIEAVEKINALNPDLIFLDIKMPCLNGFEVIEQIQPSPYIIFSTAYDDYALQAFETKSIDYLVKPVREERLVQAIDKLKALTPKTDKAELLSMMRELMNDNQSKELTSLPIKSGDKVIFLKLKDISYLKASEKYVEVYTRDGTMHLMEQSLTYIESKLGNNFLRIHRALVVNTNLIREVHKYFGGRHVFLLDDMNNSKVISSRSYGGVIKEMFKL